MLLEDLSAALPRLVTDLLPAVSQESLFSSALSIPAKGSGRSFFLRRSTSAHSILERASTEQKTENAHGTSKNLTRVGLEPTPLS